MLNVYEVFFPFLIQKPIIWDEKNRLWFLTKMLRSVFMDPQSFFNLAILSIFFKLNIMWYIIRYITKCSFRKYIYIGLGYCQDQRPISKKIWWKIWRLPIIGHSEKIWPTKIFFFWKSEKKSRITQSYGSLLSLCFFIMRPRTLNFLKSAGFLEKLFLESSRRPAFILKVS